MENEFPRIEPDVDGPDGRPGFLLIVPRSEALEWDIRNEIGSTSRQWLPERRAWWVAAPYLHAAEGIVARFTPPRAAPRAAPGVVPEPAPPRPVVAQPEPRRSRWSALEALLQRWLRAAGWAGSA